MEFVYNSPDTGAAFACPLQQSPAYGHTLGALGADVHLLTAAQSNSTVAHIQIIERKLGPLRLRWLPRGPVWSDTATDRQKHCILARLPDQFTTPALWVTTPDSAGDASHYEAHSHSRLFTAPHVAEIDLTQPREIRLAAQQGKWRNRLRRAEGVGLSLRHRPLDLPADIDLLALEAAQRRARGYASLPAVFTHKWAMQGPQATRLFMAMHGANVCAYILLLLHAPVATYHIGWTSAQGRQQSAHTLLLWRASNWLADHGYHRFDLGSVDTCNTPGLARFKIGSGAHVRPLGPTLLRLPRPRFLRPQRHAAA